MYLGSLTQQPDNKWYYLFKNLTFVLWQHVQKVLRHVIGLKEESVDWRHILRSNFVV